MSHRRFLEDQILELLMRSSSGLAAWHSEPDLEDFLMRQGYAPDLIQDLIDQLIASGLVEFAEDRQAGTYWIAFSGGERQSVPGRPMST
ncbi:MAG: hypothetical protein ACERJ2_11545 [Filomicrobium sp.]